MRKFGFLMVMCLHWVLATTVSAKRLNVEIGAWTVAYDDRSHAFSFVCQGQPMVAASRAEAVYQQDGVTRRVSSADFQKVTIEKDGDSRCFVMSQNPWHPGLTLRLELASYEGHLQTRLKLVADAEIASNYIVPIHTVEPMTLDGKEMRMMKVPFDNDGFSRYQYAPLHTQLTSYEVTAVFDGVSRRGLVVGSVDHTQWKSAIDMKGECGNTLSDLKVYSGVSTSETHDPLPHGSLVGKEIASAWFVLIQAADWRDGMETFAKACVARQEGRRTWKHGTPVGWQSWGVMSTHNSLEVDMAVADYYAKVLRPQGFCGDGGMQIMSIDAWDNLNDDAKRKLTAHCESQGQIAGLYRSPFSLWWGDENQLHQPLFKGCQYQAYDVVLKANGKPFKYDGAYCLDPTHPATKEMMRRDMEEARNQGFRYVKVDFVTNGILQADSYYNKNVRTAVEAYNEGFTYFVDQCYCKDGSPMFIALSIAPLFPYQYGNSRRIACDTWGKIGQSEYAMNAICGGWWANLLYQYNDPDHLVLVGNDADKETEGENRARLTTGVASGMLLLADNYHLGDTVTQCGDPKLSDQRAKTVLNNARINQLMRKVKHSFRPVYGYKPFNNNPSSADHAVMYEDEEAIYVAVINYSDQEMSGAFQAEELGLAAFTSPVEELWTGTVQQGFSYQIPAKDARIYQMKK